MADDKKVRLGPERRPKPRARLDRPARNLRHIFHPNDANWKVRRADPIDRLLSPDDEPSH